MAIYIKKINDTIVEAPYTITKGDVQIIGYNKETNENMLFDDGYLKYTGDLALEYLDIVDGQIIENPPEIPEVERTTFTKLEIRRALREAEKEEILDSLLSGVPGFYKEWNDAIEIDLNDPMITNAVQQDLIPQQLIDELKDILN